MKTTIQFLIAITALCLILTSCVTKQPGNSPDSPPVYSVSPELTNNIAIARGVAVATAPINREPETTNYVLETIAALAIGVSSYIAKRKNDEAKRERLAADSLAESVVASKGETKALQTAGRNGVIETVATHIDNNATEGTISQK